MRLVRGFWLVLFFCSGAIAGVHEQTIEAELSSRLCDFRKPCTLTKKVIPEETPNQRDGWRLRFVVMRNDTSGWGELPRWDEKNGRLLPCVPYEAWAVKIRDAVIVNIQLLAKLCNDGYGARGLGQDLFRLEGAIVEHRQSGGSNWGWENTLRFDLESNQLLSTMSRGWFSGGRQEERVTRSFQ